MAEAIDFWRQQERCALDFEAFLQLPQSLNLALYLLRLADAALQLSRRRQRSCRGDAWHDVLSCFRTSYARARNCELTVHEARCVGGVVFLAVRGGAHRWVQLPYCACFIPCAQNRGAPRLHSSDPAHTTNLLSRVGSIRSAGASGTPRVPKQQDNPRTLTTRL